jgi:pyridoxal phosphate enzyme (YggS family)
MNSEKQSLQSILASIPSTCKLIAVSKLQSEDAIRNLVTEGHLVFAENYVQEALPKLAQLKDLQIEWHFIGHLQRNKAKSVVGAFHLIHSVDRLELLKEVNRVSEAKNLIQNILLEINLSGEESKSGFHLANEDSFATEALSWRDLYPHVQVVGLMTMPPLQNNPEENRRYFQKLRTLRDKLQSQQSQIKELSMGTSSDYRVACEEGSTMVRLGTVLFGARIRGG